MSTAKSARTWRRPALAKDRTRNGRLYRVEATWPARPDRPAIRITPDRAAARRYAAEFAEQGARAVLYRARGFQWRPLDEYDGTTPGARP